MDAIFEVLDSIEALVSLLLMLGLLWMSGPKFIALLLGGLVSFISTAMGFFYFFRYFHPSLGGLGFLLAFPITGYFLWKISNHPKLSPNNKGNNQKN